MRLNAPMRGDLGGGNLHTRLEAGNKRRGQACRLPRVVETFLYPHNAYAYARGRSLGFFSFFFSFRFLSRRAIILLPALARFDLPYGAVRVICDQDKGGECFLRTRSTASRTPSTTLSTTASVIPTFLLFL